MKIATALQGVTRLFLDTAPVIYLVEQSPVYLSVVAAIFQRLDNNTIAAVTSSLTLAECLVAPYRQGALRLQQTYLDFFINSSNATLMVPGIVTAQEGAKLRARYNLGLLDALQVATALEGRCEALLTNDKMFHRVTELRVLILDDLEA